jgi:hypothetical protein
MANNGTYRNEKGLLPHTEKTLQKAWKTADYLEGGGSISCGHDFWDKDVDPGEVVFCERCGQFFVKMSVLPWITKSVRLTAPSSTGSVLGSNHLDSAFFAPVPARATQ